MRLGQVGGILLAVGVAGYLLALAITPSGGSVGPTDPSSATLIASVLVGGLGAVVLAYAHPVPLDGRAVRSGLGLLGAGLVLLAIGGVANAVVLAAGSDPLSGIGILFLLLGLPVTFVAVVVVSVAMALTSGRPRLVGGLLMGALACFTLVLVGSAARAVVSGDPQTGVVPGVVGTIGVLLLLLGGFGIGGLAIFGPLPD